MIFPSVWPAAPAARQWKRWWTTSSPSTPTPPGTLPPPTSTCCAWSADLSVCPSVSRLSSRRSWARTWETGPTEQRWWHALVRSQWPPCAAFIHLVSRQPCTSIMAKSLSMSNVPLSPSPPPPHTAQTLRQKMEIKRCLSCLRKSKSFCYSKLCVFVCARVHVCIYFFSLWWRKEAFAAFTYWARKHCALVLINMGQIWRVFVTHIHHQGTSAFLSPFLFFLLFFKRRCTVCFSPSRAAISHLFVFQVLWEWLPVGQVDVAHRLYHHNCWREGGRGGRKVLAHHINGPNCTFLSALQPKMIK